MSTQSYLRKAEARLTLVDAFIEYKQAAELDECSTDEIISDIGDALFDAEFSGLVVIGGV